MTSNSFIWYKLQVVKKLLVTGFSLLCIPLLAQVLQPLGSGLPLPDQLQSGDRVVASYASGNDYLALFKDPETTDTTDYSVGKWNGAYWSYYPGLTIPVAVKANIGSQYLYNSIAYYKGEIYVGGYIQSIQDIQASVYHLYKWSSGKWVEIPNGVETSNYGIMAMTVFDNKLIVVGRFQNNLNGGIVDNIAAFDGTNWTFVGKSTTEQGTDGEIKTLVTEGNRLYIGGTFQKFAGITTGNIAFYTENNSAWGGIGSPFTGVVNELASFNGKLAALGTDNSAKVEVRVFKSGWSAPISFSGYTKSEPNTIAGARDYLLIGGNFMKNGNGTNLLRFENDSLFTTGNKITGEFKLGQRGSEAFIWGQFLEQNTRIRHISKIEVDAGDVTGTLFFDQDQDCIKGNNEPGLKGRLVRFEGDNGKICFATTGEDGDFAIALPEGNYAITSFTGRHWINNCPTNYAVKVRKGLYSFVSLGQYMSPNTQDLELHLGAATPATLKASDEVKYVIRLKNSGNTILNGPTVHFLHPGRMTGFKSSPPADNYDELKNEATFTILNMQPGEVRLLEVFIKLPADATEEEKFECSLKAGSLFTNADAYKTDNFDTLVLGRSNGPDGSVVKNGTNGDLVNISITKLDYQVKFTNISSSTVNRVVLLDTLDKNIKLRYMMVYDMYPMGDWNIVNIGNRDILVAEYPKANLASLESNPSASSGYIKYYLQLVKPLQHNDQVHNRANCDFDSKWTGTSNTVTVTIADPNIGFRNITGNIGNIFPNPANEVVTVSFVKPYYGKIELLDGMGRVVLFQMSDGISNQIGVRGLSPGIYTIKTNEGSALLFVNRN